MEYHYISSDAVKSLPRHHFWIPHHQSYFAITCKNPLDFAARNPHLRVEHCHSSLDSATQCDSHFPVIL